MKPDQIIVLFLTFLTGVFAGGSLYATVFAPAYEADNVEGKSAFSIVGEMYGGCERGSGCASFRLVDDRTYQYLAFDERQEGRLPRAITDSIFENLTEYQLDAHSAEANTRSCASYADGVDYRYEITLDGVRYILDTCRTTLADTSPLQQALLGAWEHMADPSAEPPSFDGGAGGWFIERFQSQ